MKNLLPLVAAFALLVPLQFTAAQTAPPASRAGSAVGTTTASTNAPRLGSITGRVVSDDGQPLAGIRVSVSTSDANAVSQSTQAVLTDGEGHFRADGLRPAAYQVTAYAPAYVTPPLPGGEPTYYRIGETVTLTLRKGGVITGKVTDALGEPAVGVAVNPVLVRDERGHKALAMTSVPGFVTDDRGIYRLYGLTPGVYVVRVSGDPSFGGRTAVDGDVPTYHPSATADDAAEVAVGVGEEITGVDIRHRGERGHVVSGRVTGLNSEDARTSPTGMVEVVTITLARMPGGVPVGSAFVVVRESRRGFSFRGLPDGEYELVARLGFPGKDGSASAPRRVTVKGGDVTGVELTLAPLGSVAGRFTLEPRGESGQKGECAARESALAETTVVARRDEAGRKTTDDDELRWWYPRLRGGSVGEDGEFVLRNLSAGHYRLVPQLPSEGWYVRAVVMTAANKTLTDVGRGGLALKAGEKVTGLRVTIAEGAAGLKGKVAAAEGARLPARLRVHLIPAEREAADDMLRYAEVSASGDAFAFAHVAPGRYWLLARPEEDTDGKPPRPAAWDAAARAKLRREAEAANVAVELKPCGRVSDFALRYAQGK
jgi:hypothetical protein